MYASPLFGIKTFFNVNAIIDLIVCHHTVLLHFRNDKDTYSIGYILLEHWLYSKTASSGQGLS